MKVYFGFDDTDHRNSRYGTGKLARWFQRELPEGYECLGVSSHGGTNGGIIGATAAVGLTHLGWSGGYIELGALRDWPGHTTPKLQDFKAFRRKLVDPLGRTGPLGLPLRANQSVFFHLP